MKHQKERILGWIQEDRTRLIDFLSRLIQAKSPNPPGDTREASAQICRFLEESKLPYQVISPHPERPNIVSSFQCGGSGPHLVFNAHIDVFPVGDSEGWTHGPWSGAVAEGRIYGRGAADMKCGCTSLVFAFLYLCRLREELKGRLTLTAVSDEESFGPFGARYLMENHPEVFGDCFLSGDGPQGIVFGEKGMIWLSFTIRTRGCHGAYTHLSPSATKIAARLIEDLESISAIQVKPPENVAAVLQRNRSDLEKAQGKGVAEIVQKATVNIGTIRGGLKVNMVPGECVIEVDIRLPIGLEKAHIMGEVEKIVARYPEVSFQEINYSPPNWSDPQGKMVKIIQGNLKALRGSVPEPIISLGGTDARLWRHRNVAAYLYAPARGNMAAIDEHVEIEELLDLVRIHALSAYDYLTQ